MVFILWRKSTLKGHEGSTNPVQFTEWKIAILSRYYLTMMKCEPYISLQVFQVKKKNWKVWWRFNFLATVKHWAQPLCEFPWWSTGAKLCVCVRLCFVYMCETVCLCDCVCVCLCVPRSFIRFCLSGAQGGSIELWRETGRQYLDLSRPPPFVSLIFITSTD